MSERETKEFGIKFGGNGLEIKILISGYNLPELEKGVSPLPINNLLNQIENFVRGKRIEQDPNTKVLTEKNRSMVDKVFDSPVYVEEIENGYCKDYCCKHLPWFIVTTKIGRITIGWRKRVTAIDWEDTDNKLEAEELFPDENTTKVGCMIHAWSYEKAKEYITKIVEGK